MNMKDLKKTAPKLSEINSEKPFKVPEGYFDEFPVKMSDRVHQPEKREEYQRSPAFPRPYYLVSAFFVAAIIAVAILLFKPSKTSWKLTTYEVSEVIDQDIYHYNEDALADVLEQEGNTLNKQNDGLSKEDIINYLIDEDIPLNDIIDAL